MADTCELNSVSIRKFSNHHYLFKMPLRGVNKHLCAVFDSLRCFEIVPQIFYTFSKSHNLQNDNTNSGINF